MNVQFTENKLIKLFIEIDDLWIAYKKYERSRVSGKLRKPTRVPQLSVAEICTILVAYHYSGYKCFEYYYKNKVLLELRADFPSAPTYEGFLRYISRAVPVLYLWLLKSCCTAQQTGLYFVDAKRLEVCHLKRAHSNKVFDGVAAKGKSSMGWFYGLKLHLAINNLGDIVSFSFTPGNVADNNHELLKGLLGNLKGICVGDKGYLSKLFKWFYERGLHLLTKPKKNMKNRVSSTQQQQLLSKRGVIESTFDILTSVCDLEHTRHRKPSNAFGHMLSSLIAYQYLDQKPRVFHPSVTKQTVMAA